MGFLEERDLTDVPRIPEYYKGKSIFITGGTGFMGKILIEKLLYSCTDLDRIYILMRSKKGLAAEQRLQAIYSAQCFDRLRRDKPGVFESKVSILVGDVSKAGLGLSNEDRLLIIQRVNIIFHAAASVRFDDTLPVAAKLNLSSTVEIIELAKEMKNLEVLVHVSTSYANTNRDPVEEVMYPPHADWRETLAVCENVDEQTLRYLTPKYLGDLPNTYVFTKQLAEHVVYEQKGKLPIIIIRPSIVVSSIEEPVPGWLENFNGPVGICIGISTGVLRCLLMSPDHAPDYMPVDVAIRHCITAAWIRGTKKLEESDDIPIYNCCNGHKNKLTADKLMSHAKPIIVKEPYEKTLWTMDCVMTTSKLNYFIRLILFHVLPALFVDLLSWISGKKPMLLKIQRRVYIGNVALEQFLLHEWTFDIKNYENLRSCLKAEDVKDFDYDISEFGSFKYVQNIIRGSKKFTLKEKEENFPKTLKKAQRIIILDKIIRYTFYVVAFYLFIKSDFARNLYHGFVEAISF